MKILLMKKDVDVVDIEHWDDKVFLMQGILPVLIYVVLLLINSDLLAKKEFVNIFWILELELPIIALISVFFVVYIFLMYFS